MEEYGFLILPTIVGGIILQIMIYIAEHEDEVVCDIAEATLSPRMFMIKCLKITRNLGIIALCLYLLIEHAWAVIAFIALFVLGVIGFSYNDHSSEIKDCTTILRLIRLGRYDIAENVLQYKGVGKLHAPLLELIHSLKERERQSKVWNPHIQQNRALVPMAHYQNNR